MPLTLRPLRYDGICNICQVATPARTQAWWDSSTKQVTCVSCRPAALPRSVSVGEVSAQPEIDRGTAGVSAAKEHERRRARQQRKIEKEWGTGFIGKVAKALSTEPQSTKAWAKGADGERRLGDRLDRDLEGFAVVLHDRRVPNTRGNVDHLVVGPSGVWIVDAKNYSGKVERRRVGGMFSSNEQLFVGGRNQTALVKGLSWQVVAVEEALRSLGHEGVPVNAALCFTDSEWGLLAKPFCLNGAVITWAAELVKAVKRPGAIEPSSIPAIALDLSGKLKASK